MSDIFLSYSSAERDRVRTLAEALQRQGWTVWWDRTIPPGRSFDETIEEAINDTKCVVVCWSTTSVSSDWVKNEAAAGKDRRILVPVLIDDVNIPFEFRRIQAARLVGWSGSVSDPEFDLLVSAISRIVGREPKVVPLEATGPAMGNASKRSVVERRDGSNRVGQAGALRLALDKVKLPSKGIWSLFIAAWGFLLLIAAVVPDEDMAWWNRILLGVLGVLFMLAAAAVRPPNPR